MQANRPAPWWRFVVPNAITSVGMICALMAILAAAQKQGENAAWLIILCVLIDKLDGSAARWLRASSRFGVQLDSLSDFLAFGVAPAMLVYFGNPDAIRLQFGLVVYVLCTAFRLAHFNVQAETTAHGRVFIGLPTTFAGATLALGWILTEKYGDFGFEDTLSWLCAGLGMLMVSRLPFPKLAATRHRVFNVALGLNIFAAYLCGTLRLAPEYLCGLLAAYAGLGLVWGYRIVREDSQLASRI